MKLHINLPDDTNQETVVEIIGDITVSVLNRLEDVSLVSVERFPQDEENEEKDESESILDKFLEELEELDQVDSEEEDSVDGCECKCECEFDDEEHCDCNYECSEGCLCHECSGDCLCRQCSSLGIEFGSTDVDEDNLLKHVFELKKLAEDLIKVLEAKQTKEKYYGK